MWETTVTPAASAAPKLDGGTIMQQLGKGLSAFGQGYTGSKTGSGNTHFDKFLANYNAARDKNKPGMTSYGNQTSPGTGMMTPVQPEGSAAPSLIQGLMPGVMSNPWAPKTGPQNFGQSPFSGAMPIQPGMF